MNKYVTFLPVIAVMFTFSFGSAFAAVEVPGAAVTTHDEAMAEAVAKINKEIDALAAAAKAKLAEEYTVPYIFKDVDATGAVLDVEVDGSVYAATIDKMVEDYKAVLAVAAQKVSKENPTDAVVSSLEGKIKSENMLTGFEYDKTAIGLQVEWFTNMTADGLVAYVTADVAGEDIAKAYYMVYTYTNALAGMKADLNAILAKVDMAQYTNDVIKPADAYKTTYAQLAAKAKAELEEAIADTTFGMTNTVAEVQGKINAMYAAVANGTAVTDVLTYIDGSVVATEYKLVYTGLKTAEELGGEKVSSDAAKASLIAQIKANVAEWTKNAVALYQEAMANAATPAQKDAAKAQYEARLEKYAAYEEVYTVLVSEGEISTVPGSEAFETALERVAEFEEAEEIAATLKLEVEKEGSAKYNAAKIDELLADLKVEIYAGRETADRADFADARVGEDLLEWNKAHAICEVEDAMEEDLYDECGDAKYYAPEQAKVEAKYAEKIAKIEAAATQAQLDSIDLTVTHTIKNKTAVRNDIAGFTNTTKFVNAVNQYIGYLNYAANAQDYSDAYRASVSTTLTNAHAAVKYLAGEGARTNADVAGFLAQAEAYAQTVKTNGELKAAKVAAEAAIKALPNVITLADKDAVKAAKSLAVAGGVSTTTGKLAQAIDAVKAAELKAIADMIKALPKTLTAADDAAVSAIYSAIYAFEDECLYGHEEVAAATYTAVGKAYDAVRAAWLKDVHAAIAAVDAEDEASVEAAREAVDAYVARYTSVCADDRAIDDIKNMDKLTYAEAQVALAKIEAVEALKITASSKATKGAITVKWTVKGDTSAVEGYEIWKSTKKNSGFKKAFTATKMSYKNTKGLKKGTKYYYKVRAIAYVGAEKITSDWSNKAYRVAK